MYLVQGVKQGCNLSPTLFNIFLVEVIEVIDGTRKGITINGVTVTIVAFADDLVIIAKYMEDMKGLITKIMTLCEQQGMEVSEDKSRLMRVGKPIENSVTDTSDVVSFSQVLEFKYLGVHLNNKTSTYFGDFANECTSKSKIYRGSIMSKAKTSHDPIMVAQELWNKVAVPAILYGSEVLPIRQAELRKLDSDAASIGKFILQLPQNTTNVTGMLVGKIYTMRYEYMRKVIAYNQKLEQAPEMSLISKIYKGAVKLGNKSGYIKSLNTILTTVAPHGGLDNWYLYEIANEKASNKSTCWLLPNLNHLPPVNALKFVEYSTEGKIYNEFVTMNAGLGNRAPQTGHPQHKFCPLCARVNKCTLNNEIHLLFVCDWLTKPREDTVIKPFMNLNIRMSNIDRYREFWTPINVIESEMRLRIDAASLLRDVFFLITNM